METTEELQELDTLPDKNEPSDIPTTEEQKAIIDQIEAEYQLAYKHQQTKRTEQLRRLKLYNNQKRNPDKVGDPLLFTVFQTVFAQLYNDRLGVRFEGWEDGDDETAENTTAMAEYDYRLMGKDEQDYYWDWNTCFFGRGLCLLDEFDKEAMCPVMEVIDPMLFLRDPRASSVNGDQKGYGGCRFFGWEIGLSKAEMEENPAYFNIGLLKKGKDLKSLKKEANEARAEAQGRDDSANDEETLDENYEHELIQWFTKRKGKMYLVTLGNSRKLLVRYQELKGNKWPVIDRTLFPMANDWDGVSIPDLIEDKQRARAVMINLGMESALADLYPVYIFDQKRIKNPADLDFDKNKFIPVNGDTTTAMTPVQKATFHQQVNLILNILDVASQKAVSAPETSQGVQPSQERTLGETALVAQGSDTRRSLAARIWGWSERRFWQQWYWLYKTYFEEGTDKKRIRIQGPLSASVRTLTRENIVSDVDPDVYVEPAYIAEAKRDLEYRRYSTFAQTVYQDPGTNRRYVNRRMAQLVGMKKAAINLMFPPTIDEMDAEEENQLLDDNKLPTVEAMEDDIVHIEIHSKASETAAKLAHIEAHKQMMRAKRENPELFQATPEPSDQPLSTFSPVGAPPGPSGQQPVAKGIPAVPMMGDGGKTQQYAG